MRRQSNLAFLIINMAAICVALGIAGCASQRQQSQAHQALAPVQAAAQNAQAKLAVAQTHIAVTVARSQALTSALARAPATQPAKSFAPQSDAVTRAAIATQASLSDTNTALQKLPAAIATSVKSVVKAEVQNENLGKAKVKSGLIYRVGRYVVIGVSFLLLFGLIIFGSETGWATSLAAKWPILSACLKPFEWCGSILGKLWGYVEKGIQFVWSELISIFSKSSAASPPAAANTGSVAAPVAAANKPSS